MTDVVCGCAKCGKSVIDVTKQIEYDLMGDSSGTCFRLCGDCNIDFMRWLNIEDLHTGNCMKCGRLSEGKYDTREVMVMFETKTRMGYVGVHLFTICRSCEVILLNDFLEYYE